MWGGIKSEKTRRQIDVQSGDPLPWERVKLKKWGNEQQKKKLRWILNPHFSRSKSNFLGYIFFTNKYQFKSFILVCKVVYHQYVYAIFLSIVIPWRRFNYRKFGNKVNVKIFDIVSLAHNVSFWAQKLTHYVSFWAQKLNHYVSFWAQKTLKWANFCSNGFFLFLLNSYII